MTITIITVGSKPKNEINNLIQNYSKRLPGHVKIKWRYLKHEKGDTNSSVKRESESILRAIPKKNKIILLDESGEQFTSPKLSNNIFGYTGDTTIIIGGAYGVSGEIKSIADTVWSLGKLVYPHQLVRLILIEQIYRCYCISTGHPYHHS